MSELLEVENEILAFDLDRCFAYQLSKFDSEQKKQDLYALHYTVNRAFAGKPLDFGGETKDEDGEVITV